MGNRKEEILIVALHLFARDGYEAVSVSQIAGELDMPQEDKEKMPEKYETVSFDEFESIGIVNAKDKAARFYSVMFFITRVEVLCIASA